MCKSLILFVASVIIFLCQFSNVNAQTWQQMMDSTKFYQEKSDFENALKWAQKALPEVEKEFGKMDTNYVATIGSIAEIFYYQGKLDSAIYYGDIHLKICRTIFKSDHPDLANSIENMANFYKGKRNFEKAETLYIEVLELRRRIFKTDHPDLASSINSLAVFYGSFHNYKKAESLYTEALEMYRRLYKNDHPDLASSINNLAYFYDIRRDFIQAESLYLEALEMRKRLFKGDHPDLAKNIFEMAYFYDSRGDYRQAELFYNQALKMGRRLYKADDFNLAWFIKGMADILKEKGDYSQAEPLYKESLEMSKRLFKGDDDWLPSFISSMALFYLVKGDYKKAEPLFKEVLEMTNRLYKSDHPSKSTAINNMALFYDHICNYKQAELLYKEGLEMSRRLYKNDHIELAISIENMARLYKIKGDYNRAEPLFIEDLEMMRRIFKNDNHYLVTSLMNLGSFYNDIGDYKQSENMNKESLEMCRRLFKGDHPFLAISINNNALFYKDRGDFNKAESLYLELENVCSNLMNNYFPSLSEKEKEQYFNTFSIYYLQFNNFSVLRYKNSLKLIEIMFENQIITKSMLLSSTNKIKSRILLSNDSSLISLYTNWKYKKVFISKLYQLSDAELKKKNFNLDSIINVANDIEKELTKRSELFKNEYEKEKLTWQDVQKGLSKDEAVVEIVRFNYVEKSRITDIVYYVALIVKKNSKVPELVLFENGAELESIYIKNYYNSTSAKIEDLDSYNQFWAPIAKNLKGIKKVFVSPDGVYNQINLVTLKNEKTGKYLLDEKEIVVLGSSRDLVKKKKDSRLRGNDNQIVELFGDPKFSLDSAQHQQLALDYTNANKADMERGVMDSLYSRSGISQLPGTKTEIENIFSIFQPKGWDVRKHLSEGALEEAVKAVNNPRVLHIATHGLFLNDIERAKDNDMMMGMEIKRFVENPLLRSMLLFAGAENTITKASENNSMSQTDDGLLTAYEAMNLNLENTELVVLSACETGLGTIKNGEGVYGLQRAFIQAGAKTLIMSLWKVNDQTTQELMTAFYTKWLGGKSKRQAFNEAQQQLKKKYPEPYYWGAFVMVGE
ncbi:MAG: CHAT domain-containing tetratricopeptide repeat protein [Bacteroidota bacterium]